jgi:hypothetical protein
MGANSGCKEHEFPWNIELFTYSSASAPTPAPAPTIHELLEKMKELECAIKRLEQRDALRARLRAMGLELGSFPLNCSIPFELFSQKKD